jgi:hypothetical protein
MRASSQHNVKALKRRVLAQAKRNTCEDVPARFSIAHQERTENVAKERPTHDRKQPPFWPAPRQCTHFAAYGNSGYPEFPRATRRNSGFLHENEGQNSKKTDRFLSQIAHFRAKSRKN